MGSPRWLFVALTLGSISLAVAACGSRPSRAGRTPFQTHMAVHYERTAEIHDALVKGILAQARPAAGWISTHQETRRIPEGSGHFDALMRHYARQVFETSDLRAAFEATAQMGRTCGDCHRANGVTAAPALMASPPPAGGDPKGEMALHVWAARRMWDGLVGPDDRAWEEGSQALTRGWLQANQVVSSPQDRERVRSLLQTVYDIGSRGPAAADPQERARLYGEFLATCADCHRLTGAVIR